ncbi:MAG TPA: hypothetical protein DCW68_06555 [Rhodospirillaceae bacterium]|nr:MAG: hypothetical protein A2018_01065 [Alphaproteobacteria bacterium GWF2_58_20]HAU29748.1 hypothetical protein [Rhodospirillaceae bacterium]
MSSILDWLTKKLLGDSADDLNWAITTLRKKSGIACALLKKTEADKVEIIVDPYIACPIYEPLPPVTIRLLGRISPEGMAADLAHELFHHHQFSCLDFNRNSLDVEDAERFSCALEAAADCASMAICAEIAQAGDEGPFDAMRIDSHRKKITHLFYKHLDIFSDDPSRFTIPMREAFFAWHGAESLASHYKDTARQAKNHTLATHPERMAEWGTHKLRLSDILAIATLPGQKKSWLDPNDPRLAALLDSAPGTPPVPRKKTAPGY